MKLSLRKFSIVILIIIAAIFVSLFSYKYLTRHNDRETDFRIENLLTIDFEVMEFYPKFVSAIGPKIDNKRKHFRLDMACIKVISPEDFKVFNIAEEDYLNKFCIIGYKIPENHPLRNVGGLYRMVIDKNKIDNGMDMRIEYIKSDIIPIGPNHPLQQTGARSAGSGS